MQAFPYRHKYFKINRFISKQEEYFCQAYLRNDCLVLVQHQTVHHSICADVNGYLTLKMLSKIVIDDISILTLLLLNTTCHVLANSVDPDHLAVEEAN